jgi:hypothetical protein
MKKIIFSFLAVLLITGCTPPAEEIDVAKEEEAIKKVIKEEVARWADQDYIAQMDLIKNADYIRIIHNQRNFHNVAVGWDSLFAGVKRSSERDGWQYVTNLKVEQKDFNIKVYDKLAWAAYYVHEYWEFKGEPWDETRSRVTFLEKEGDDWKIVLMTSSLLNPCEEEEEDEEAEEDDVD